MPVLRVGNEIPCLRQQGILGMPKLRQRDGNSKKRGDDSRNDLRVAKLQVRYKMWNGFGKPDSKRDGKQKGWRIITGINRDLRLIASFADSGDPDVKNPPQIL